MGEVKGNNKILITFNDAIYNMVQGTDLKALTTSEEIKAAIKWLEDKEVPTILNYLNEQGKLSDDEELLKYEINKLREVLGSTFHWIDSD